MGDWSRPARAAEQLAHLCSISPSGRLRLRRALQLPAFRIGFFLLLLVVSPRLACLAPRRELKKRCSLFPGLHPCPCPWAGGHRYGRYGAILGRFWAKSLVNPQGAQDPLGKAGEGAPDSHATGSSYDAPASWFFVCPLLSCPQRTRLRF